MSEPQDIREILENSEMEVRELAGDFYDEEIEKIFDTALKAIDQVYRDREKKVTRLEVIDESGRAYVKGSIYGTPIKVKLDYQDDGRTLKVFVNDKEAIK